MRQSKLTDEQRLDVVRSYLAGAGSYQAIAERFHVSNRTVRDLVALYQSQGEQALRSSSTNNHYTAELKRQAVEDYQAGLGSQREICAKYNIRNRTQLRTWIKQYETKGCLIDDRKKSSAPRENPPGRKTTLEERVETVCFCLAHDKDYPLTVSTYKISYQQIYSWVRKYKKYGLEGLIDKRGRRKDPATMTPLERLQAEYKILEAENRRLQVENAALKKLHILERRWD